MKTSLINLIFHKYTYKTHLVALIETLEEFYPDKWDLQIKDGKFNFYIYYPAIKISNSEGNLHIIKDFYVKLSFKYNMKMQGFRKTFSNLEMQKGYSHSHLSNGYSPNFNDFCFGSDSPLSFTLNGEWSQHKAQNKDYWKLFIFELESYLSWESLEGGPYTKLSNLRDSSITRKSTFFNMTGIEDVILKFFEKFPDIDIFYNLSFTVDINTKVPVLLENDFLIAFLKKLIWEHCTHHTIMLGTYAEDGIFENLIINPIPFFNEQHRETNNIFKGEILVQRVYGREEKKVLPHTHPTVTIYKPILNYLMENINRKLKIYYTKLYEENTTI
jgi:hypothetical protein